MNDSINSPIHAIAEQNYKLTRAAWYALYAPDAGRHDALTAEDVPTIYARLFDAILDGSRGLARLAVEDGEELALLDYIAQLPRPRLVPTRRLDIPDNPDLAAALFGTVGDMDDGIEIDGIGVGDWPAAPAHTCAAKEATGTALVIRSGETYGARMFNPTWRTCPACLHKRVKRIARQTLITIAAAGAMSYSLLDKADYRRWSANIRQHRHRKVEALVKQGVEEKQAKRSAALAIQFRALPQEGGRVFVMSTHGLVGTTVPTERRALFDLIHKYAVTPDNARASSSRGYGGDYRKLRGDGRGGGVRLWTDARLEDVATALGSEVKKGRNTIRVKIEATESYQKLVEAGITMHARKGQGSALEQLMGDVAESHVTLKAYSDFPEEYALSVTDGRAAPAKVPDGAPTQADLLPAGGAPCAIYLV